MSCVDAQASYHILILITPTTSLHDLAGHPELFIERAATASDASGCLKERKYDAILSLLPVAAETPLLKQVRAIPYPQRPLLCLVDDAYAPSAQLPEGVDALLRRDTLPDTLLRMLKRRQHAQQQADAHRAHVQALRAELERERQAQNAVTLLKNAIVRTVSHELKTPLLQVKSAVALIASKPEDDKTDQLIRYATDATVRLESVVKNITMLGESLDHRAPQPFILRDSLDAALRDLRRMWAHRYDFDRVHSILADDLPPILADKQGISTVLQLLVENALKFSTPQTVTVRAERCDDKVQARIAVEDQGIGIPPEQIDTIFESFYQGDDSDSKRYGGTGVGLAIVKLILDHHQTTIHVESTVGKGSTFWFKLPTAHINRSP